MPREVRLGDRLVGDGHPTYVIAEIGINHNGDLEIAKQMIDAAVHAGADAVKFQKRTPELCVPPEQRQQMRETPWGYISYLDYRYKVEFSEADYREIDAYCRQHRIQWFASVWDEPSVDFLEAFHPVCYKIPSASLTDHALLRHVRTDEAAGDPLHRNVDDGADPRRGEGRWHRRSGADPFDQHLPVRAGGAEPADDRDAAPRVRVPGRLLGP